VRITHFRAKNLLTFENLDLDFTDSPLTILVGPNGAGKTNVFRLIHLLIDVIIAYGIPGSHVMEWMDALNAWKRKQDSPASIEIDIEWTEASEGESLANYIQMALTDPDEIARTLSEQQNNPRYWPGWSSFTEALIRATPGSSIKTEWSGTLGLRYYGYNEIAFYFKPCIAKNSWVYMLGQHPSGIVLEIPEMLPSATGLSLASIWIKSLAEANQVTLLQVLQVLKGEISSDLLSISVNWPDILAKFQSEVQKNPEAQKNSGIWFLNTEFRSSDRDKIHPQWKGVLQGLGVVPYGQQYLTFTRVLANLLHQHCIISEDLISPPANSYSANKWSEEVNSLTSQNLSAYLLKLKNSQDDRERSQFEKIQETFEKFSGRQLNVVSSFSSDSNLVTLIQHEPNDSRSVPLDLSGSGLVEMAYLSAVLNSPNPHVILLDEPGRSLHPQAIIKLRYMLEQMVSEPSAPQMIVITHSPYLVPPSMPHIVRRVRRTPPSGCTEISCLNMLPPNNRKVQLEVKRRNLQRQDQWGRSPNWPALLFSTMVLLVDGETELGALPEWYQQIYNEPVEALGGSILSLSGKAQGGAAILDLNKLDIPWVALIDGDSLAPGSGNIWAELQKASLVTNEEANHHRSNLPFKEQVQRLEEFAIYVMGQTVGDNLETVLKSENPGIELPAGLGESKVIKGRFWAQKVKCPQTIKKVFKKIREVAFSQSGIKRD
jgi:AAA15 family ATPase/GTPase